MKPDKKRRLGRFETAQVMTGEQTPFNLVIVMRLHDGPSSGTLRTAVNLLRQYHPSLNVYVKKCKKDYFFVQGENNPIPLAKAERRDSDHWKEVVETELDRPFSLFSDEPGNLMRITHLRPSGESSGEGSEVVLTFQHAIVDGASLACFLHDLLRLCGPAGETGEPIPGFKSMDLLPPADTFFPPAYRGWRFLGKNIGFMFRQMADELHYRRAWRGKVKAPVHPVTQCKILTRTMAPGTARALAKVARRERVTLNSLLNAAFLLAAHQRLYNREPVPVRHFNFGSLRPYLVPPMEDRYLGSYFSMMRYTIPLTSGTGIWDLARLFGETAHLSFKRGEMFSANRLSYRMMKTILGSTSMRMGNTALSFTGPLNLDGSYGKIRVDAVHAFVSNFGRGPEYAAQARVFKDAIIWDIIYLDRDMDKQTAARIIDDAIVILESAIP